MPLFAEIKKTAKNKESKQAFVDLACLLLFSEKKFTMAEQEFIKRVLALESAPTDLLEQRYELSMSKVKRRDFDMNAFIDGIAKNLPSPELKTLAEKFIDEFYAEKPADSAAISAKIKGRLASFPSSSVQGH